MFVSWNPPPLGARPNGSETTLALPSQGFRWCGRAVTGYEQISVKVVMFGRYDAFQLAVLFWLDGPQPA